MILKRNVTLNRLNIKTQLIELFSEPNILSHDLIISIIAPNGKKELGVGIGVTRETFCLFFEELFVSSGGREKKYQPLDMIWDVKNGMPLVKCLSISSKEMFTTFH